MIEKRQMTQIPLLFLKNQFPMRASELAFGLSHGWINAHDVVDALAWWWGKGSRLDDREVEIASLLPDEMWKTEHLLPSAAAAQAVSEEAVRALWTYLLLAWLLESQILLEDPLAEVERVYCDLGHPAEMQELIRYMPAVGERPVGEQGLLERWRRYVERRRSELARDRAAL
ncbi:MAG: DUF2247 family protein [Acidobacteria bacterium]|nr:DUF2247 family protein [Acidobacteriota bacterium]